MVELTMEISPDFKYIAPPLLVAEFPVIVALFSSNAFVEFM